MEELTPAETDSPVHSPIQQGNQDPDDPLNPELDQDPDRNPPISAPHQDPDVTEDREADLSDDESVLSEIDEAAFEDFDPAAIAIPDRPIAVDETNVSQIQSHKRKRADGEDGEPKKKRKEKKRDKPKKPRKSKDSDDNFSGGEELEGKRSRKRKDGVAATGEKKERVRRPRTPENEDNLTPEERRKRALDRAMDDALKNPNRRGKRAGGIDLEAQGDELVENMRLRMSNAAQADTEARESGQPAMHKLKLLPEVVALLNRNTLRDQICDPDINLLEAVRFFLEPLNDGSLPAYNIQRELFTALGKLPVDKQALVASGIGKVTLFYTKSQKAEANIKRMAERLLGEWTRPILKRSDDYRKREFVEATYDPNALPIRNSNGPSSQQAAIAEARERKLATPSQSNRARVEGGIASYNIVPRSTVSTQGVHARPMGASGEDAFRKMKARQMGKTGGGSRR